MVDSEYSTYLKMWRASEDYKKKYEQFYAKIKHIVSIYKERQDDICRISDQLDSIISRTEIGSASDLHRGYYCPSLTFDIVVGNVKRGHLLKRLTSRSKKYYVYGFDNDDRMIWCKEFSNSTLVSVEYLIYEGHHRYGFKLSTGLPFFSIAQEEFQNGRITSYLYGHGYHTEEETVWVEWQQECYHYDEIGLAACEVFRVCPAIKDLTHDRLVFSRDNGYLRSYYRETLIGLDESVVVRKGPVYDVHRKREA